MPWMLLILNLAGGIEKIPMQTEALCRAAENAILADARSHRSQHPRHYMVTACVQTREE